MNANVISRTYSVLLQPTRASICIEVAEDFPHTIHSKTRIEENAVHSNLHRFQRHSMLNLEGLPSAA